MAPLVGCVRSGHATTIFDYISTFFLSRRLFLHRPLLFSTSRSFIPRARGLRPPGVPGSNVGEDGTDPEKSRNEKKREARRAVGWGMELAAFSAPQIKRVLKVASLEREVFDAIMLVKRLGADVREGRRRQFNYIGRLLRDVEPELMDALIQASKDGDNSRLNSLSGHETLVIENDGEDEEDITYDTEEEEECFDYVAVAAKWFDGLVHKDPLITKEVFSVHNVEFDRQELRKLVRQVQSIEDEPLVEGSESEKDAMLTAARKPLIRFLRSLAKKSLAE